MKLEQKRKFIEMVNKCILLEVWNNYILINSLNLFSFNFYYFLYECIL